MGKSTINGHFQYFSIATLNYQRVYCRVMVYIHYIYTHITNALQSVIQDCLKQIWQPQNKSIFLFQGRECEARPSFSAFWFRGTSNYPSGRPWLSIVSQPWWPKMTLATSMCRKTTSSSRNCCFRGWLLHCALTIWILRAEIQGRKPLKLPQGDWLLVSASWWEHFNGNSTKSLRKFDHCYWIPRFFITRCLFPSLVTSPKKYGLVVEITMQCEGRTESAQPDHVNFVQFVVDQEGGLTWFGEEPLPCTVLGWWETGPTDGGNDKKSWACDFLDRSWSEQTSNVAYPLVI